MRTPSTGNASLPPDADDPIDADQGDEARTARGRTLPNVAGRPAPRLPHERDESSDSGAGGASEIGQRAHDDVESGKTGTDKGEATDAVYERNFRGDTPGAERD